MISPHSPSTIITTIIRHYCFLLSPTIPDFEVQDLLQIPNQKENQITVIVQVNAAACGQQRGFVFGELIRFQVVAKPAPQKSRSLALQAEPITPSAYYHHHHLDSTLAAAATTTVLPPSHPTLLSTRSNRVNCLTVSSISAAKLTHSTTPTDLTPSNLHELILNRVIHPVIVTSCPRCLFS